MAARLVFLGRLEDMAGGESLQVETPMPWSALMTMLGETRSAEFAELVAGPKVKTALNGALLPDKTAIVLSDGDELAFLPPVSGG